VSQGRATLKNKVLTLPSGRTIANVQFPLPEAARVDFSMYLITGKIKGFLIKFDTKQRKPTAQDFERMKEEFGKIYDSVGSFECCCYPEIINALRDEIEKYITLKLKFKG
jgi:hypothetical protein